MNELTKNICPKCKGEKEITCPECHGSGKCSAQSSTPLHWDKGFTLQSIIDPLGDKTRGFPFCQFGECATCNGKGKSLLSICRVCGGTGICPICSGKYICRICNGKKKIECKVCNHIA